MNMYESIFARKATKKFIMEKIVQNTLDGIMRFANGLPMLIEHASAEYRLIDNTNNNITEYPIKAPYYFALTCDKDENSLLNAGYLIQQMVLFLNAKGFGTYYLSHFAKDGTVRESSLSLKEPTVVIAFGKAKGSIIRDSKKPRRLSENNTVIYKSDVGNHVKLMIKGARLAPSYLNSQPWRFVAYDNRIHIFGKKNFLLEGVLHNTKTIDMGIMLANLLQVAEELWIDVEVKKLDNITNKNFKKNEYVISVLIK